MKIIFVSDLHGKKPLYNKLLKYALDEKADCIIIGGDLFPTWIAPLPKLISGNIDFNQALDIQLTFIDSYLAPLLNNFIAAHPYIRLLIVPGNHDWERAINHFIPKVPEAVFLHNKAAVIDNICFFGYGCVTDSPFWVKDYVRLESRDAQYVKSRFPLISSAHGICLSHNGEYAKCRPSIEEELDALKIQDAKTSIGIFHCPPYDTPLDTLFNGRPIGSRSIRKFIEGLQPKITLHGHIHESPYMSGSFHTFLQNTLCVNPGHHPNTLHAVCFETSDPIVSLKHSVFVHGVPRNRGVKGMADHCARALKSGFINTVLT